MKSILLVCLLGAGMGQSAHAVDASIALTAEALQPYLFDAARTGDAQLLSELIARGSEIDAHDVQGNTALILAAYHGRLVALDVLLQAGADLNLADVRGNTALMGALFKGETAIANRLLADPRTDVNTRNHAGQTAAMFAALFGRDTLLEALAARGADLAMADARGATAEVLARQQGNGLLADRIAQLLAR
ncbi:ankyrin repeat domain-containing protein [Pseudoxanthomonas sp. UTMC 1351]|uniref:ankyrin repeat domain-containing protein n=1 Tax=Pseudoxanthomonas sp. UTMC 1351 TaxID=2695853 RepID=UPI0034CEA170